MSSNQYFAQVGGLPSQTQTLSSKAVFKTAYAVIPKTVMSDIVTSVLPHWDDTRAWIIARPMSGFAETFAQYIMEVKPGGGSVRPQPDARASAAIFVVEGEGTINYDGNDYPIRAGSFVYLPAAAKWAFSNESAAPIRFHWVRKAFKVVDGLELPPAIFTHEDDCVMHTMPDTEGRWATTRFIDPSDVRHDDDARRDGRPAAVNSVKIFAKFYFPPAANNPNRISQKFWLSLTPLGVGRKSRRSSIRAT